MNRRIAVKNLVIASGGFISLPFWMQACGITDQKTHDTSFTPTDQQILAKITDTFIPASVSAVGALSVGVDKYLQKMIDDCFEKPVKENVKNQLQALHASAQKKFNNPFIKCNQQQGQELLLNLSKSSNKDEKVFFELMKSQTILGFNTSQKVMQDFLGYKIAPGHYLGCVTVKS